MERTGKPGRGVLYLADEQQMILGLGEAVVDNDAQLVFVVDNFLRRRQPRWCKPIAARYSVRERGKRRFLLQQNKGVSPNPKQTKQKGESADDAHTTASPNTFVSPFLSFDSR